MRLVMPLKITGRDLNEHEWECDWVFWGFSSILSSSHLFICKSWGLVVVVVCCSGTEYLSFSSILSVFALSPMLWMNVAWKASGQRFAGSGLVGLSWELLLLVLLLLRKSSEDFPPFFPPPTFSSVKVGGVVVVVGGCGGTDSSI